MVTTKTCTLTCLAIIWHVAVDNNDESKELKVGFFSDHRTFPPPRKSFRVRVKQTTIIAQPTSMYI